MTKKKSQGGWSTMTAEERSVEMKRRIRVAKTNKRKADTNAKSTKAEVDSYVEHVFFIFGRVSKEIELYCAGAGVPRSIIAGGVAELLRHTASR